MLIPLNLLGNKQTQSWSLPLGPGFPSYTPLLVSHALSHLEPQGFTLFSIYTVFQMVFLGPLTLKYHVYADSFQIYISSLILTTNSKN